MTQLVDLDDITPDESLQSELRKTRVTTPLTRVLLGLVVLSVGFLGGALVTRHERSSASSTSNVQSLISQFRAARGGGASGASGASGATGAAGAGSFLGGGGGAGGGATIGTVKLVDGKNVYVEDTSGNVVKVTTNASTDVTVSKRASVSAIAPGSTIIVQGAASKDGLSVAATSISPSSGFGRGFGGGAATGSGG